jgi:MraZ protein
MLIGEYIHKIDAKSRISLPAKFRGEMGTKVVITPGLEQCLFVFTTDEWAKVSKRLSSSEDDLSFLKSDKRSFNRYMFGRAAEVEVDSVGRILLPEFLKERIKLGSKAALVGVRDRVEIWNEDAWKEYKMEIEEGAADLAEKLGEEK